VISEDTVKHQDSRCQCKCPDVSTVGANIDYVHEFSLSNKDTRSIYINSSVKAEDCNCQKVVLTQINLNKTQADSFCPRCQCKYQVRSLTIIKVVVILVIWVISILVIYMGFLSCLEPLLNRRGGGACAIPGRSNVSYREHRDEIRSNGPEDSDDDRGGRTVEAIDPSTGTPMHALGGRGENIIQRLDATQSRWKRQVQEQRRNIYDKHNMLN